MTPHELFQHGLALHRAGDLVGAESFYRRAVALAPNLADAWHFLGTLAHQAGDDEQAVQMLKHALRFKPGSVRSYNNLGEALRGLERLDEAENCFRAAVKMVPDYAEAHQNLGVVLGQRMKLDAALAEYERALRLQPQNVDAHVNRALIYLARGDYTRGWPEYDWRLRMPAHVRTFDRPTWDGTPLDGRTILVYAEQGFGDTIQFARFLPPVTRSAKRLVFECQPELAPLVRSIEGIDVIEAGRELPPFDVVCALLSLPRFFKDIPAAVPYLTAPADRVAAWRGRVDRTKRSIGIAWATNALSPTTRRRSCRLADLAPLAREDVNFYSLQKGPAAAEAAAPLGHMQLVDFTAELHDFAETAALIANLDVVVSVDTAVVHVAGAIGKPVHVLVPFASDWRWLLKREDSPWYPTARLWRQQRPGDWAEVIERLARELHRA
jgi:hypothetical protein